MARVRSILVILAVCVSCLLREAQSVPLPSGGSLRPLPLFLTRSSENGIQLIQRLPTAVADSYLHATNVFKDNFVVFLPAFSVFHIGLLLSHGWKYWLGDALKTAFEWGLFGATYSAGERFFTQIRAADDNLNQYIACGICAGAHRAAEGLPAMAHGFVTGFAFVYVLEHCTNLLAEYDSGSDVHGSPRSPRGSSSRNALEGTLAARGSARFKTAVPISRSILSKFTAPIVSKVVTVLPRGLAASANGRAQYGISRRKMLPHS